MPISPTAEGFRTTFRQPSFTLAEIAWRWAFGATAVALFFFGLFEYLDTLPVTSGELLFLRTRQPFLVAQAIAHILRGSLYRAVMSLLLAFLLLSVLWMLAASLGRIATVRALVAYFREVAERLAAARVDAPGQRNLASNVSTGSFVVLLRLNFLRIALALALILGLLAADIIAGFVSTPKNPEPGLAFLLFLPIAALVVIVAWVLNWLLSLAGVLAARSGDGAIESVSSAVTLCRARPGAVFAVSAWTGLAHLVAFVGATTVVSTVLGFAPVLPWRLVMLVIVILTIAYFAVVDWLYMARLAGYVCILEIPEAWMKPAPPMPAPLPPAPPVRAAIDRDELILSDVPGLIAQP
jgi:hypothetical protein